MSASDLTNIQQRGRHRSVENLQRRSSSGNASSANNARLDVPSSRGSITGSASGVASGAGGSKKSGAKNVVKKKDGVKTVAGRSLASKSVLFSSDLFTAQKN